MTPRCPRWVALFLPCLLPAAAPAATPEYLPDTTVMIRVGERVVRAREFVDTYFQSWPEFRPPQDSLGRVQFMEQFIKREVMAAVARRAGRELGFEDRIKLRQHRERVLSNVLFRRLITDSARVSAAEIAALKAQYSQEKHLRGILFADLPTARRVRADLVAGKLTWAAAHRRYSKASDDVGPLGSMGWVRREIFEPHVARRIFDIGVGEVSEIVEDSLGAHVITVVEARPCQPSSLALLEGALRRQLEEPRRSERFERITAMLRQRARLAYDTANILYASQRFEAPRPNVNSAARIQITVTPVPKFGAEDTSRVLARHDRGHLTLGEFIQRYRESPPLMRPPAHTLADMCQRIDAYALGSYKADLAQEMGLDQDPLTVAQMDQKRDAILVEHLFTDSIQSKVFVPAAERRAYYERNVSQYLTYASARFAAIRAASAASADSILARLRAGEPAEKILAEDSLRYGEPMGRIITEREDEEGTLFHKVVFEELRPGQARIQHDDEGRIWVVQSLAFDAGRQLPFQEVEHYVIESLENIAGEKLLDAFIARHRRSLRIESHPERVMRIEFVSGSEAGQ